MGGGAPVVSGLGKGLGIALQAGIAAVLLLLAWQLAHGIGAFPAAVPSPIDVGRAAGDLLGSSRFWTAVGQTLSVALIGWAIAAVIGVLLGMLIGTIPLLEHASSVLVEFGRSFPMVAILPIVILIMGANARMEIFLVALSCFWPVLVQTIYGVRRLDPAVVDTVQVFRIPTLLRVRRVLLPAAMPFISTGLRVASSIAILVAIGIEILTQTPGIGRQITLAQETAHWDVAFAYLFFAGLLGWAIAGGLSAAESRALRWNRRREG